ncbi:MAG: transglycosylase SLT domain-containing protein [Rikenellaceae bacterium]
MICRILFTTLALTIVTNSSITASESKPASRSELRLEAKIKALNEKLEATRISRGEADPVAEDLSWVQKHLTKRKDSVAQAKRIDLLERGEVDLVYNPTVNFNPSQIDSLLSLWIERESQAHYDSYFNQYICIDPKESSINQPIDTIYKERLKMLASPVELPYNSIVKAYINRYTSPSSKLMDYIITRSQRFFPFIEEELIKANLPVELRAMAIVESALNTNVVSQAGAAGLWQFMPSTGAMYGLEINSLVDERCDPVKSTIAACRFMGDLYKMYGDWSLAIAAYNCGPGNVNKALARSGLKKGTYWDIYDYLPSETRGYLPAFIGASYAYAYHKEHDITPIEQTLPLVTDTVTVRRILHLGQVAEVLDLPIDILRKINPQYRRDIIPATTKSYSLTLPQRYVSAYIEKEEQIHSKDSAYLKEYINPANIDKLRKTPHNKIHVVRSGDTISEIAKKYKVTTRQIMAWNNLKNAHKISVGQKLKVSN